MTSIITMVFEAAGAFFRNLAARRPTLGPLFYTMAGITGIAVVTGKDTSLIVKYSTDFMLGLCSAQAFMVHDEAAIKKLMVFLLWEVYRVVQWYKVRHQRPWSATDSADSQSNVRSPGSPSSRTTSTPS